MLVFKILFLTILTYTSLHVFVLSVKRLIQVCALQSYLIIRLVFGCVYSMWIIQQQMYLITRNLVTQFSLFYRLQFSHLTPPPYVSSSYSIISFLHIFEPFNFPYKIFLKLEVERLFLVAPLSQASSVVKSIWIHSKRIQGVFFLQFKLEGFEFFKDLSLKMGYNGNSTNRDCPCT
jgi:hypothetical protein